MASEVLVIPEEHLLEVIEVITTGLQYSIVDNEVRAQLVKWCDEHLKYFEGSNDESLSG